MGTMFPVIALRRDKLRQCGQLSYSGPPISAPPTRDVPSFSTGRPVSDMRLTADEAQIARSLGITAEEYLAQKKRMHQLKAAGVINGPWLMKKDLLLSNLR